MPVILQLRTILIGTCGGAIAWCCGLPLPWLIGSILAVLAASFLTVRVQVTRPLRNFATGLLLTGVGLTFTVAAGASALRQAPMILLAAFATLAIGLALSPLIARLAGVDRVTAFFCTVPGGPAEMGMLAERLGVNPLPVTVSQLLRIVSLVVVLPPVITATSLHGDITTTTQTVPFHFWGMVTTLTLSFSVAFVLRRAGLGAAFIVGPLLVGVGLSMLQIAPSSIPAGVLSAAQVVSGAYLGAQFNRQVVVRLAGFLAAALVSVVLLAAGCAAVGIAIGLATGIGTATMVLATAPGSVTEMAITAKLLGLDTPMVLAFHIARICIVMVLVQPCFRLMGRIGWIRPEALPPQTETPA